MQAALDVEAIPFIYNASMGNTFERGSNEYFLGPVETKLAFKSIKPWPMATSTGYVWYISNRRDEPARDSGIFQCTDFRRFS